MAAFAATAAALSPVANMAGNGEFEFIDGTETSYPWDWRPDAAHSRCIPCWNEDEGVRANNAFPEIALHEQHDGVLTFDGNANYLTWHCNPDVGWGRACLTQRIEGLQPGRTYILGCIYFLDLGADDRHRLGIESKQVSDILLSHFRTVLFVSLLYRLRIARQ